jgi:hypothetical protein
MDEEGMRRLVHDVSAARKKPILKGRMDELFDAMWPRLESARLSRVIEEVRRSERDRYPGGVPVITAQEAQEAQEAEVVDLLAALRASVEAAKERRRQWNDRSADPDEPDDP